MSISTRYFTEPHTEIKDAFRGLESGVTDVIVPRRERVQVPVEASGERGEFWRNGGPTVSFGCVHGGR